MMTLIADVFGILRTPKPVTILMTAPFSYLVVILKVNELQNVCFSDMQNLITVW